MIGTIVLPFMCHLQNGQFEIRLDQVQRVGVWTDWTSCQITVADIIQIIVVEVVVVTGFEVSKVDTTESPQVDTRRIRVVKEPSSIGYVDSEASDFSGVVKDVPCLLLFQVCKADISKDLRLEDVVSVAGSLEAREEVVLCKIVADEVEDERNVKDGDGEGMFVGNELHGRRKGKGKGKNTCDVREKKKL